MEYNLMLITCSRYVLFLDFSQFRIDFYGVQDTIIGQSFRQTQGRITGIGADFQYRFGFDYF